MLLFWTIIGAEYGHFEVGNFKTVFETFLNESISVSTVEFDLYKNLREVHKKFWPSEISMSTEISEGLEISGASYKFQNGSKSMCFFGI